ncbi:TPA: ATP-dependent helicase [Pseudomonas aeruginosa]|uniref:DNA 3'-5' helicase n=1 Tax=Pseudomonas extremaustralis TaxID=359110 RepID=A0A5C5Q550_9PSED|nr:ATP-dependent helicase [Pseudomonas extremaustralis]EZI24059.1 ATP-dependent DNA helicase [Pseudomonas extremaustralis 14-3 substr. 14-3b]TWR99885.1 ATP-dependent helicase [Pseudomonas extremaustralis]SDF56044.1 Superfamily I DNA or RNA helicase [Pseudomonas extremaustralis]
MFTWTSRELNAEQSEAVLLPGSVFLVACPGSGKTRALTYKIAYELSRLESDRQFIVAITYTHRAADEIQERIEDLGVDTSRLWIGTIHSFCLEWIIKPYGIYAPELAPGYRVIDQHEREKLLERLCAPYASQRVSHYDCDYFFTTDGYYLGCPNAGKHAIIHRVLAEYFRILAENRQIDFELILWHASQLIDLNPAISVLLSKLFALILVDEYQDTKQIQYSILGSILRAGAGATRLFMVGDPNQAIYGSLGGYPIEIGELRRLTEVRIAEQQLSQNYRSSSRIIDYFGNFNVYSTAIAAAGDGRVYPSLVSYDSGVTRDDLVHEIVRLIRHNVETLGIPPSEVCVLAPQWLHLASMTRQLVVNMPDYQFDGPGMVPFARDIENFWYKLSRLALTEPSPSLYVRRLRWAGEVISEMKDAGIETSRLSRKSFLRECNAIPIDEDNGLAYLRRFFATLFERLGIQISDFAQLQEHHQAFFESSESRIAKLEAEGVDAIGDIAFFRKVFQNRTGITVSTIHGVKGAEFDVVIAYALLEGMVPHFNDADGDTSAQKLLYVVGSRARKNLHLFSETGRKRGRYNVYVPTRMLAACVFNYDDV